MSYREVVAIDSTVIQQSLTVDIADYKHMRITYPMQGVILEVYPVDRDKNRSAQQTIDRHGHSHECTVLIVNDGTSPYMVLEHVIITPDSPSGLDDFEERLPRGTTGVVTDEDYDPNLHGIDPFDLDGDWCIVSFIGGKLNSPFISRWYPHSRNVLDTATSGYGINGDTLVQNRRYFKRTNGIETVITSKGDIVISTTFANSKITPSQDPALGRIARNKNEEEGGSIRVNVKPTQSFELTFNPQEDGIGVVGISDQELPQKNPYQQEPASTSTQEETYIYIDRDQVDFLIPSSVNIVSKDTITIKATNVLELEGAQIKIGENAADNEPVVLGEQLRNWLKGVCKVLSPFGPLSIDPNTTAQPFNFTQSTKSVVE